MVVGGGKLRAVFCHRPFWSIIIWLIVSTRLDRFSPHFFSLFNSCLIFFTLESASIFHILLWLFNKCCAPFIWFPACLPYVYFFGYTVDVTCWPFVYVFAFLSVFLFDTIRRSQTDGKNNKKMKSRKQPQTATEGEKKRKKERERTTTEYIETGRNLPFRFDKNAALYPEIPRKRMVKTATAATHRQRKHAYKKVLLYVLINWSHQRGEKKSQ